MRARDFNSAEEWADKVARGIIASGVSLDDMQVLVRWVGDCVVVEAILNKVATNLTTHTAGDKRKARRILVESFDSKLASIVDVLINRIPRGATKNAPKKRFKDEMLASHYEICRLGGLTDDVIFRKYVEFYEHKTADEFDIARVQKATKRAFERLGKPKPRRSQRQ
jgi:hypothetical protein